MIGSGTPLAPEAPILAGNRLLKSEAETAAVGASIAGVIATGDVLALWGGLGSGKTVFARGFIRAWLGPGTEVPSPTFTLVQIYDAPKPLLSPIYHFDLFRLGSANEAIELGFEDALETGVALIEWPDRLGDLLPDDRLDIILRDGEQAEHRELTIAGSDVWRLRLDEVATCWA